MNLTSHAMCARRNTLLTSVVAILGWGSVSAPAAQAPAGAASVGYTVNTFSSDFSPTTVDVANSGKPGFSWYPWNLYGRHTNLSAITVNSDNSVTLAGDKTGPNGELITATAADNSAKFVGTAFGGGAYIEAELKFSPDDVARAGTKGWPSFWSLELENSVLSSGSDPQWPGQPQGYKHAVEVDFFEYLYLPYNVPRNIYGAGMHEWYGIQNVTCGRGFCVQHLQKDEPKRQTPGGTDFTQYHRFGFLWVPATENKSGYARFYFDGKAVGPDRSWTKFTDQPPPPTNQTWAFGRLDQQHQVLILGTGIDEPMTVRTVNVWQASEQNNVHQ
jgi:hypothetical protein